MNFPDNMTRAQPKAGNKNITHDFLQSPAPAYQGLQVFCEHSERPILLSKKPIAAHTHLLGLPTQPSTLHAIAELFGNGRHRPIDYFC